MTTILIRIPHVRAIISSTMSGQRNMNSRVGANMGVRTPTALLSQQSISIC